MSLYLTHTRTTLIQAEHMSGRVMSKPMGSERSVILITKLLLLNFLLLWQLGTGATYDNGDKLAAGEENALQLLVYSLQSSGKEVAPSDLNCSDKEDAMIKCSCDNINEACSITKINLVNKKLDGSIPSFSEDVFKNLQVLNLSNNQLTGVIPSSLGNLQSLEILKLSNNMLSGPIPENLTRLRSLKGLYLDANMLTGSIPDSLTMLHNLTVLNLEDNNLDGTIPRNLTGLRSLNYLDLSRNKLSGPIPDSIQYCKQLVYIIVRLNTLSGTIPDSLGTLKALQYLDLYSNSLSGHIPPELRKLSALTFLNLDDNNLDGRLPEKLGDLVNLKNLYLSSNKFTESIPETYQKLINLEDFVVGGNNLSGKIPNYFGKWVNLTKLTLIGNNFEGNLPPDTFNLKNLQILLVSDVSNPGISFPEHEVIPPSLFRVVLRNCKINGSILPYIGKWSQLKYLDLSFNNLSGDIPESFQKVSDKLFLTDNSFKVLPSWISKPNQNPYPKTDLSYNYFDIKCPNSTCLGLQDVNIHPTRPYIENMKNPSECRGRKHNSLYINCGGGDITIGKHHYHNDTSTSHFNLIRSEDWAYSFSGDYLWATINESTLVRNSTCEVSNAEGKLENNYRLAPVSLIYYGLCLRKGKYFVKLHFAETLYSKGEDNSQIGKRIFDVYIQGKKVKGDLNIKELNADKDNDVKKPVFRTKIKDGSLEIKLFWTGKGSLYNPPSINGPIISAISITRDTRLPWWAIVAITAGCILFLLLLFAFMWRMGWIGDRELRETKIKVGERSFTVKQIIDATKNFSPKMELGRGRSGIVYKAELAPDLTVAVKKLSPHSKVADEIATEVYAKKALDLRHENLVKLHATYSRRSLHLLIYEYMELGSLGKVLFGTNSTVQLDWPKRFTICRGLAKGLKYLHERKPQIIHRNMKTNNILLDTMFTPKISDFGLAKLYEEDNPYHAVGADTDLLYMSPEYATRRAMTVKVDVYSFGILLLEIVSGRNNADYRPNQETVFLLDTAGNLHAKQRLAELVDTTLHPYDWDQASTALNLAIMCTDQSPSLRPTMSQIVTVLEREKTLADISKEINTPST